MVPDSSGPKVNRNYSMSVQDVRESMACIPPPLRVGIRKSLFYRNIGWGYQIVKTAKIALSSVDRKLHLPYAICNLLFPKTEGLDHLPDEGGLMAEGGTEDTPDGAFFRFEFEHVDGDVVEGLVREFVNGGFHVVIGAVLGADFFFPLARILLQPG